MKCRNCGINYEDDERVCPMCGTRAGRGSRARVPRYTGEEHRTHSETQCTHRTFPARPASARAAKRSGVIAGVLAVLLALAPLGLRALQPLVQHVQQRLPAVPAPEPEPEPLPAPQRAGLAGCTVVSDLPQGGAFALYLGAAEDGDYALSVYDGWGEYTENGAGFWLEDTEGDWHPDGQPPADGTGYLLCLTPGTASYAAAEGQKGAVGAVAERLEMAGDLWLYLLVREDGTAALYDLDGTGLLGGAAETEAALLTNG